MAFFGEVGFGEAYMNGLWDRDGLEKTMLWFARNINSNNPGSGTSSLVNALGGVSKVRHWMRSSASAAEYLQALQLEQRVPCLVVGRDHDVLTRLVPG